MTRISIKTISKKVYFISTFILLLVALSSSYQSYYKKKVKWRDILRTSELRGRTEPEDEDESLPSLLEARIAGGSTATYGQIPYQAYLYNSLDGSICGGTLISVNDMRAILTAAHCIWVGDFNTTNPVFPFFFKITLGDVNLLSKSRTDRHYNVSRVVVHDDYDPRYRLNDIGLVFLSAYVKSSTGERPMDLPEEDFAPPEYGLVSGYGISNLGLSDYGILKVLDSPLFDWDYCKFQVKYLTNNHFCTSNLDPKQRQGHCFGDSGGPVVGYNSTRGKFYLYGVISFGDDLACGLAGRAQVNTRVSKYIEWIHSYVLSHKAYCGTGHPILDHPDKYPKCPWRYDNPCWYYEECIPYP